MSEITRRQFLSLRCLSVVWLVLAAGSQPAMAFEWQTATPESQGMSSQKLDALKESLAARKTKALLVVRNDKIVCEWYAPGHGPQKPHMTASLAKALVGGVSLAVAMTDGRIALDDPAVMYVPQWKNDPRRSKITVRHLGSHTSGIEDANADGVPHEKLPGWKGEFWKRQPTDPFTLSRDVAPVIFEPGTKWAYSNPGIAMLSYCVTAAIKEGPQKDIRTLLRDRVMRPIGVANGEWSVGYGETHTVDGLPLVASAGGGNYTARAAARVGRLMLREGDWDGTRIMSAAAVRETTADAGTPGTNGMGWWSNNEVESTCLPKDAYYGAGSGDQVLLVVPSLNLIAVRNGDFLEKVPAGDHKRHYQLLFEPLVQAITGSGAGPSASGE